jgi:hypothetical protein
MEELNLPRHLVEAFEKRWARKLQQLAAVWQASRSPARSRTDAGVPVDGDRGDVGLVDGREFR